MNTLCGISIDNDGSTSNYDNNDNNHDNGDDDVNNMTHVLIIDITITFTK